jgi:hypothetical protein
VLTHPHHRGVSPILHYRAFRVDRNFVGIIRGPKPNEYKPQDMALGICQDNATRNTTRKKDERKTKEMDYNGLVPQR